MCKTKIIFKKQNIEYFKSFIFPRGPQELRLQAHLSPINDHALIVIRIVSLLYLSAMYIYDFRILSSILTKFLFFTNIAYFGAWLYFIAVVQHFFLRKAQGLDEYAEVIFEVTFCFEWIITVAYWTFIRPSIFTSSEDFFLSLNAHCIALSLIMLDFIFNSFRFVYTQYFMFLIVCAIYLLVVNFPYSIAIEPVYGEYINWVNWYSYVFILAAFLGSCTAFIIARQVYTRIKKPFLLSKHKAQTDPATKIKEQKRLKQFTFDLNSILQINKEASCKDSNKRKEILKYSEQNVLSAQPRSALFIQI